MSKRSIIILSCLFILASCSSIKSSFSPEQVISNALNESEKTSQSYVGEARMTTYENDKIVEEVILKEWVTEDSKIRIESEIVDGDERMIAVNNGQEILTYMVEENQVLIFDEPDLFEFNTPSPKEQAMYLLEMIHETHHVEVRGEEDIAGRKTFHIKALPKESSLYGTQELWIDKQNWMVLKMITFFGDTRFEVIYEKINFNEQLDDEIFQIDLPDDVERINVSDLANTKEVSLTGAVEALGESFLYIPAKDGLEIDKIELNQYDQSDFEHVEISLEYTKDSLPLFFLAIFKAPDDNDLGEGQESQLIRGKEGTYTDTFGFRSITWDEDELRYSVILHDPDFTLEQFLEIAENMELVD